MESITLVGLLKNSIEFEFIGGCSYIKFDFATINLDTVFLI